MLFALYALLILLSYFCVYIFYSSKISNDDDDGPSLHRNVRLQTGTNPYPMDGNLTFTKRGGLVIGRRTCDLGVAGSRPGRDAAA